MKSEETVSSLLSDEEPPPFEIINPDGRSELVLVCDHASNRVPFSLNGLGLSDTLLASHIAWDPGAAALARALAVRLDATLVLSNYSRLVIDCNRPPSHRDSIPVSSDHVLIPGNAGLDKEESRKRQSELFEPYHNAIAKLMEERAGRPTQVLSIHSFTPVLAGVSRPWSIGVCYQASHLWAKYWLVALRDRQSEEVGDNEPYDIDSAIDYTLPVHCELNEIPCIMLEVRQDKLAQVQSVQRWSELIAQCWLSMS